MCEDGEERGKGVCVCVTVSVGVDVIAWAWKEMCGCDSLDCCRKVCV